MQQQRSRGAPEGARRGGFGPERTSTRGVAPRFRTRAGPLSWSTDGHENEKNVLNPEHVWKENVDRFAATFGDYGYTMVCGDGWIDHTRRITPHG